MDKVILLMQYMNSPHKFFEVVETVNAFDALAAVSRLLEKFLQCASDKILMMLDLHGNITEICLQLCMSYSYYSYYV